MMIRLRESRRVVFGLLGLGALVLGMLCSHPVSAQIVGATLSGAVTDAQGAAIPNAKVSIKNTATGVTRDVTTNESGAFTAPNLLPGDYEMTVSATGFSTHVQSGITLTVGAQQGLNVTMAVGEMTQRVEVTGEEAVNVELTSSAIGAVVNSNTMRELPLNGRSWTDLTALQPGVGVVQSQPSYTSGGDRGNRGFGQQLSISGMRPVQNNYRLDGISLNTYDNGGPGSAIGGNLGVDAIQEFSVLTTNYSAEYGKTSGGVVNAISRSGTNSFHGNVYEFLRNSALDARNFFDYYGISNPGHRIAPYRRNQFGASAGGPIHKGTTFIFGDYEGLRSFKGIPVTDNTLSQDTRNGIFNISAVPTNISSFPGAPACVAINATQCKTTVSSAAAAYFVFFPLPNVGALTNFGTTGTYNFAGTNIVSENFFTFRVDQKFSDKDSLFGTYKYDKTPFSDPDAFNTITNGLLTFNQVYSIEETHLFSSSLINTARFGYNRNNAQNNIGNTALIPDAANPALATVPGFNAAEVFIGNVTSYRGGLNVDTTTTFVWNSFQGYDDAFVTRGNHSMKFGFAVERMQLNMLGGQVGGRWTYDNPYYFVTNVPTSYTSTIDVTRTHAYRQTIFGGYAQDDWRFRPNLTLNLGLRYEMSTVPIQTGGQYAGRMVNLAHLSDATPVLGDPAFSNPTLRNFEPRVGFAWDPFKDGKTSVRGGFGMFDVLPMMYQYYVNQTNSSPYTLRNAINNRCTATIVTNCVGVGSFYNHLPNVAISGSSFYFEPHPKRNYTMQWNLNLQRAITPTWTANAGYVGSRGIHMSYPLSTLDSKQPTLTAAGYLWPCAQTVNNPTAAGCTNPIVNSNFSSIAADVWGRDSFYHAMLLGLTKRLSHGLQAQTSFTWGKSEDDGSATVLIDQFQNAIGQNAFDPHRYRSRSDFDITRTLVINVLYVVPKIGSFTGFAGGLTNGWEMSSVFKLADGVPFTPTVGATSDPVGATGSPYDLPNRIKGGACDTAVNVGNVANYINASCFTLAQAPDLTFYNANCNKSVGNNVTHVATDLSCLNLFGNAGRNSVVGPGQENLDFSLVKNTPIRRVSEAANLQFRTEFFNILNRANFATIRSSQNGEADVFGASGNVVPNPGKLISTTTDSREIQFALKFIW